MTLTVICTHSYDSRKSVFFHTACQYSDIGGTYTGSLSVTVGGVTCLNWEEDVSHKFESDWAFPDDEVEDAENYCRNPDGHDGGPWCFIPEPDDPTSSTWDECGLTPCV